MNQIRIVGLLLLIFFVAEAILAQKGTTPKWGDYLGELSWDDAVAQCQALEMRLPKIDEFKKAEKTGVIKKWKEIMQNDPSPSTYWSSERTDEEGPSLSPLKEGEFWVKAYLLNGKSLSKKSGLTHRVRCISN